MYAVVRGMLVAVLVVAAGCRGGDDASGAPPQATTAAHLVAIGEGVARDPRNGLEWTSRDHDEALAWEEADRHCRELVVGERRDWRLPEIGELETLYDARFVAPCGERTCHLDPAIHLGGPYVWSVTTRGPGTRFYFDGSQGTTFSPTIRPVLVRRVLCVRTSGPSSPPESRAPTPPPGDAVNPRI